MLLAEIVAASRDLALTRSRTAKTEILSAVIKAAQGPDVALVVFYLTGVTRQQRLGVGWASAEQVTVQPATEATVTLADVDTCFEALSTTSGQGSQAERQRLLAGLLGAATAVEAEFLQRLITGELRHGALDGVVTDAVARAAGVPAGAVRRAAMLSGSLAVAATAAMSAGKSALDAIGLRPLTGVQPMLASTALTVADAVTGVVSVEWKLDGIRIQAHRDADDVVLFTRNLNDVTHRFPDVVATLLALPVTSVILDGELIGLTENDLPRLFQDTASSFASDAESAVSLRPFFFDMLHIDGVDLIDRPLFERHAELERVAGPNRVPTLVTSDHVAAEAFAAASLAAGHEGVMVKDVSSRYEAGRRGTSWRKVKPVFTFDLIVLGAEWGHGRRRGWLSNLHLAARDPNGGSPIMVGKTFKGLTDELLTWQTAELQRRCTLDKAGTVFVTPDLVIEIAVDGVQRSTRYPGGVALRFARVKRYRPDKRADEADSIDALQALLAQRPFPPDV